MGHYNNTMFNNKFSIMRVLNTSSMEAMTTKKRFLRDGVLDLLVADLREWDNKAWTIEEPFFPSFSIIITMFEFNRVILQKIEAQIEKTRNHETINDDEMRLTAYFLQTGLKNAYEAVREEWMNAVQDKI